MNPRSALVLVLVLGPGVTQAGESDDAAKLDRQSRFEKVLLSYPQDPERALRNALALVGEGPFADRARALHWLGSARLVLGDRAAARSFFERVRNEHPATVWAERSLLGTADADAQEKRYGEALQTYTLAMGAQDAYVRELARISRGTVRTLQQRHRIALAAIGFAILVSVSLLASTVRAAGARALWPLPLEARLMVPVLALISLLALQKDAAPRGAVFTIVLSGLALTWVQGAHSAARLLSGSKRAAQAAIVLAAFAGVCYAAIVRADMVGMVLETLRVGPE